MLYLTCSTRYSRPAASFSGSFGAVWDVIECSGKPHHSVELEKKLTLCFSPITQSVLLPEVAVRP